MASDVVKQLEELKLRLNQVQTKLDPQVRAVQIRELEAKTLKPDFWSDPQIAQTEMKRLAALKSEGEEIDQLEKDTTDALAMAEVLEEKDLRQLEKRLGKLEVKTFLNGKYDSLPAILSIHAGQGGTEAMDWTAMLMRMYLRFIEKRGWAAEVIEQSPGEEAGYKSVSIHIPASYAYGYLQHERGTHRLVRQSPFNADALRQTSFALVEVLPAIDTEVEIAIKDDDLEWEFSRSSGHGGQNVNKVSTAVRLTHKPSGMVVTSQTQRTQEQNRKIALGLLKAKLWQAEEEKRSQAEKDLKGAYKSASWGNQIRSYVLHPYKLVKDLRTQIETSDAEGVLDGELDMFVDAEIRTL